MAAYLVPIGEGRTIPIQKAVVFVGRHPQCDLVLTRSRKISRKHCCIVQVNDRYLVRDLGSLNGVRLNGKRVQGEEPLEFGDELTIADVPYVLSRQDTRAAAKPAPAAPKPLVPAEADEDVSRMYPVPIAEGSGFDRPSSPDAEDDVIPLASEGSGVEHLVDSVPDGEDAPRDQTEEPVERDERSPGASKKPKPAVPRFPVDPEADDEWLPETDDEDSSDVDQSGVEIIED